MTLLVLGLACSFSETPSTTAAPEGTGRVVHEYRRKWYRDADGDGHGDPDTWHRSLTRPPGHVANATDCDDERADVYQNCALLADADLVIQGMRDELIGWPMVVGDPTGDGIDDVIIGSHWLDNSRGHAYIVAGPADGTVTASDVGIDLAYGGRDQIQFGKYLAAGDANSDGYDDVIVGSFKYGSPRDGAGGATVFTFFGPITSRRTDRTADAYWQGARDEDIDEIVVVSDLTGDSIADVVVGSWDAGSSPTYGAVFVVDGSATGTHGLNTEATCVYRGTSTDGHNYGVGLTVADLGDATGDGISDFATQSALDVAVIDGGDAPGSYDAATAAAATVVLGLQTRNLGGGDWDGDGLGDLFVPGDEMAAFLGPLSGTLTLDDASATWVGGPGSFTIGDGVIAVGNADGDDSRDVLIGDSNVGSPSTGEGIVYLQRGLVSGTVDVDTLLSFPAAVGDLLGVSGAFVRDWTGDGADEIALGSTTYTTPDERGAIYVVSSEQIF